MEIPEVLRLKIEDARLRLQRNGRWRAWLRYCMPVSACCLTLALVSRVGYVPGFPATVAVAAAAGAGIAALLARRVNVDDLAAAAYFDMAEGLKERLSTVVELSRRGYSGELARALVADAVHAARGAQARRSLPFRAPRTLPLTLSLAIAGITLSIVPHPGRADSPADFADLALAESVRVDVTARLLKERGASRTLVEQVEQASRQLKDRRTRSALLQMQSLGPALQKALEESLRKESFLEDAAALEPLRRLAALLTSEGSAEDTGEEARDVFETGDPRAAAALKQLLNRLAQDSALRKGVEEAISALEERDEEKFVRAVENVRRELRQIADADVLAAAKERLDSAVSRLAADAQRGGVLTGAARAGASPDRVHGISPDADALRDASAIEDVMERERVPERFRDLVRVYFTRTAGEQRKAR